MKMPRKRNNEALAENDLPTTRVEGNEIPDEGLGSAESSVRESSKRNSRRRANH